MSGAVRLATSLVGNHRTPTTEEEDLKTRSLKKVKTTVEEEQADAVMDQAFEDGTESPPPQSPTKPSYRDKVMAREFAGTDLTDREIVDLVREELIVGEVRDVFEKGDSKPFNPNPVVPVSLEEYEEWCRPWKFSLVVKLLGKKIGFKWMTQRIQRMWARDGELKVIDLTAEFYLVRFASEKYYLHALFEGPWMIADHYLMVQRWCPMFKANDSGVKRIAVWIRLPELPVELYTETFLWRLGSLLGTMLKIDTHTTVHSRGKFARICVELDLSQQLNPTYTALGEEHRLEYEGLHSICFSCGRYGHRKEFCPATVVPTNQHALIPPNDSIPVRQEEQNMATPVKETPNGKDSDSPNGFGPWMMAKKSSKRKPLKQINHENNPKNEGSRFQVLEEETSTKEASHTITKGKGQENQSMGHIKVNQGQGKGPKKSANAAAHPKNLGKGNQKKETRPSMPLKPQEQTGMPLGTRIEKESSPEISEGEEAMLAVLRQYRRNLWEDFQATKEAGVDSQDKPHAPSNEDLRFILALLKKKGVMNSVKEDPMLEHADTDMIGIEKNSSSGDVVMMGDQPQPSI
ncbi:uncharacterized protein LOC130720007 [Lotus japonicus]|uniref:uncharacterized protein LOC130720007 n=1 Tax=Lotus japonicus TaxID=34305 RepID=UPI00258F9D3D|nr:uncharacterized protein LOC130720007 [Lotus japonicus]